MHGKNEDEKLMLFSYLDSRLSLLLRCKCLKVGKYINMLNIKKHDVCSGPGGDPESLPIPHGRCVYWEKSSREKSMRLKQSGQESVAG